MSTQSFVWTCCPNGLTPDRHGLRVSVLVSPRLARNDVGCWLKAAARVENQSRRGGCSTAAFDAAFERQSEDTCVSLRVS